MKHIQNEITQNLELELLKIRRKIYQNNVNSMSSNSNSSINKKLESENFFQSSHFHNLPIQQNYAKQDVINNCKNILNEPLPPSFSNLKINSYNYNSTLDHPEINFPIRKIKTYTEYEMPQNQNKFHPNFFSNVAKLTMNNNNGYLKDNPSTPFEDYPEEKRPVFGVSSIINSTFSNELKNYQQPETTKRKSFNEKKNIFPFSSIFESEQSQFSKNLKFDNSEISNYSNYPEVDKGNSSFDHNSLKQKYGFRKRDFRKQQNGKVIKKEYTSQSDYLEKRGPCRHCGRSFQLSSLNRHERICLQVFFCKRQKFDSSQYRFSSTEQRKLFNKSKSLCSHYQRNFYIENKKASLNANSMNPKFNQLQLSKNKNLFSIKEKYLETQERIECPYCLRKFNPTASNRHIPFCMNRAKIEKMKRIKTIVQK